MQDSAAVKDMQAEYHFVILNNIPHCESPKAKYA